MIIGKFHYQKQGAMILFLHILTYCDILTGVEICPTKYLSSPTFRIIFECQINLLEKIEKASFTIKEKNMFEALKEH